MKPFTEYLINLKPTYDFVVRIAGCEDFNEDMKKRVQASMDAYVVENFGSVKRLPIKEHADFPSMGACEVCMMEVTLKYPVVTDQLRKVIAESIGLTPSCVMVRTKLEEANFQPIVAPKKAKDGSVLNNPELAAESGQDLAGQRRVDSMLKDLSTRTRKFEYAAKEKAPKGK
jgi:Fe-S cluster biogenesis protein NfuA